MLCQFILAHTGRCWTRHSGGHSHSFVLCCAKCLPLPALHEPLRQLHELVWCHIGCLRGSCSRRCVAVILLQGAWHGRLCSCFSLVASLQVRQLHRGRLALEHAQHSERLRSRAAVELGGAGELRHRCAPQRLAPKHNQRGFVNREQHRRPCSAFRAPSSAPASACRTHTRPRPARPKLTPRSGHALGQRVTALVVLQAKRGVGCRRRRGIAPRRSSRRTAGCPGWWSTAFRSWTTFQT